MTSAEINALIIARFPTEGSRLLSKELGMLPVTLCGRARRLGLKISKENLTQILRKANEKEDHEYPVNPEQFREIVKPEIAYILGLLWADGFLTSPTKVARSIILTMVKEDRETIEHVFSVTGTWKTYFHKHPQNPTWKETSYTVTHNRPIYDLMTAWDYRSKSASPTKILSHIPENLRHYWWRGYFDGDGGLYLSGDLRQLSFASEFEQDWSFVIELLTRLKIPHSVIRQQSKKGHKSSCVRVTGYHKCKAICDYLYQDYAEDKIGLPRKYAKYQELLSHDCKPKSSSHVGVGFDKQRRKWKSTIHANEQNKLKNSLLVGFYSSEEEAFQEREKRMKQLGFSDRIIHKHYSYIKPLS